MKANHTIGESYTLRGSPAVEMKTKNYDQGVASSGGLATVGINSYIVPTPNDVLLKMGEESRQNPGNIRFHEVSDKMRARFQSAENRPEKDAIAEELATLVEAWGGRFLGFDCTNGKWYEINTRHRHRKCLAELIRTKESVKTGNGCYSDEGVGLGQSPEEQESSKVDNIKSQVENVVNRKINGGKESVVGIPIVGSGDHSDLIPFPAFSLDRLLQSQHSRPEILSSIDTVSKLLTSQSSLSIDLPDLPPLASIDNQDDQTGSERIGKPEPPSSSNSAPAQAAPCASIADRDLAEARERQDKLVKEFLQGISLAPQIPVLGPDQLNIGIALSMVHNGVGVFDSRAWGTELGVVQDVDVKQIFQSESGGEPDAVISAGNSEKRIQPRRKERDWNALVMEGLSASMPSSVSEKVSVQAPVDSFLKMATAPASQEKQGSSSWTNSKEHSQADLTLSSSLTRASDTDFNSPPTTNNNLRVEVQNDSQTAGMPNLQKESTKKQPKIVDQTTSSNHKTKRAAVSSKTKFVEPRKWDVLMGRGGRTNNHPGNKRYLEVKDEIQTRYLAAAKNDKTTISQELVDKVHGWGGRFLKLVDDHTSKWFEVDQVTARKKCSQSLREINTPEERAAKRAKYAKMT